MQFFSSGFFWLAEGVFLSLIIIGFKIWMEDKGVRMVLWKWILFIVWIILFGFTIAFTGTCLGENEVNAAVRGGIIFSFITILAGFGLWHLLKIGTIKNRK